ncbi:MAG: hypothetical protein ACLRL6_00845 [Clostridium sp.]
MIHQSGNAVGILTDRDCDHQENTDGSDTCVDHITRMSQLFHTLIRNCKGNDQEMMPKLKSLIGPRSGSDGKRTQAHCIEI